MRTSGPVLRVISEPEPIGTRLPMTRALRRTVNGLARVGDGVVLVVAFAIDRAVWLVARALLWFAEIEIAGSVNVYDRTFRCGWCLDVTDARSCLPRACCRMSMRRLMERQE